MSNTPFDDDDEFGFDDLDFDDNELDSGSEGDFGLGGDTDDFDFGTEDEFDFGTDDFDLGSDEDEFDFQEDDSESSGPSRTFIYIAGAMVGLFVIALIVLVLLASGGGGPSDIDLTTTAIVQINSTTEAQLRQTQTAAVLLGGTQTQQANLTATQLARPTDTPTPTATLTPSPDATLAFALVLTEDALSMTEQALEAANLTATAQALEPTGFPTIAGDAVALTATALANFLQQPTPDQGGGVVATPTVEGGAVLPTALPDTGLFDDLATGGAGSLSGLFLAILGLIGVIVISRRMRTANR